MRHLLRLYEIIRNELIAKDLLEEAEMESLRVEETAATQPQFDPEGFWRMRGAAELSDVELAFLQSLWILRDRLARASDRPAFKTIPDSVLLEMAKAKVRQDLFKISFLHRPFMKPVRNEIIGFLESSRSAKRPDRRRRVVPRRVSDAETNRADREKLESALKEWRREEALARKVAAMAILPNHLLEAILLVPPRTTECLRKLPHFGRSRLERYGAKLLEITTQALT